MQWGNTWANLWGGTPGGPKFVCDLAESRIFSRHPSDMGERDFRDFMCAVVKPGGVYLNVVEAVKNAFSLEDAAGVQLDIVGRELGLARSGSDDDRYRVLLGIQVELILAAHPDAERWAGTGESILRITRQFIGVGGDPIILRNTLPKDYVLTVPGVTVLSELELLAQFLTRATWSEVLGHMLFGLGEFSVWNSATPGPPIPGAGNWGSATAGAPIADVMVWATDVLIGDED